jgi:hypothetical protein
VALGPTGRIRQRTKALDHYRHALVLRLDLMNIHDDYVTARGAIDIHRTYKWVQIRRHPMKTRQALDYRQIRILFYFPTESVLGLEREFFARSDFKMGLNLLLKT